MGRRLRAPGALLAALALAIGSVGGASASPTHHVGWAVAPSGAYSVRGDGAQPLVAYRDCLRTGAAYAIAFTATVDTDWEGYAARFATTGEATQAFGAVDFSPPAIRGAQGTTAFGFTLTFRTGDRTFPQTAGPERERFGVYLEEADGDPLADSFLTIDVPCIRAAAGMGCPACRARVRAGSAGPPRSSRMARRPSRTR